MPFKDPLIAKQKAKEYREKNKQKNKEYQLTYRERNKEKLRLYRQDWYKSKRGDKLLKTYGISLEDYHQMLYNQDGFCCICSIPFTENTRPYVDHNHSTGQVRGLLCFHCNTGLGHFKDNYKHLVRAARYVK